MKRLAFVLVFAIVGSAAAQQPRPAGASRIVSLVPALTEMLFAVGAGPQIVGVSSFDDFPADVKALPRVGALLDPDMERIFSLRPDLVIIYGSQTDVQRQLEQARIRTYSYRHAGLAGVLNTIRDLGTTVGKTAQADRVARDLQTRLDAVKTRVAGQRPTRTLLVFERDPGSLRGLFVSGGVGFLHDMLEIAGGTNVFADVRKESVQPSMETILAKAPDTILEIRPTGVAAADIPKERRTWDTLSSVPAVKKGRVQILTGEYLVVPGPRVAEATEAIARALHPEAFK
jgi:iron complex transport system substrate-binding protein